MDTIKGVITLTEERWPGWILDFMSEQDLLLKEKVVVVVMNLRPLLKHIVDKNKMTCKILKGNKAEWEGRVYHIVGIEIRPEPKDGVRLDSRIYNVRDDFYKAAAAVGTTSRFRFLDQSDKIMLL